MNFGKLFADQPECFHQLRVNGVKNARFSDFNSQRRQKDICRARERRTPCDGGHHAIEHARRLPADAFALVGY